MLKGINKGIIKGLNLQNQSFKIHLFGNWVLGLSLQYYFLVILNYSIEGIWYSKIIMESFIVIGQTLLIECWDWNKLIRQAKDI